VNLWAYLITCFDMLHIRGSIMLVIAAERQLTAAGTNQCSLSPIA